MLNVEFLQYVYFGNSIEQYLCAVVIILGFSFIGLLMKKFLTRRMRVLAKSTETRIDDLLLDNTFTVTTGHQLNLFTGPLYYIIKILSAIKLTQQLKEKHPDFQFVPLFISGGEDHDFEEINHVNLHRNKLTWDTQQKGPVGRFSTSDMESFLEEVKKTISSDLAKKLIDF